MATEPAPETAPAGTATKLKLDPPDVLQPVAPAHAAGLVPLKSDETSELDKRVSQFVDELARRGFSQVVAARRYHLNETVTILRVATPP